MQEAMVPVDEETQATITQERVTALRPFFPTTGEDDMDEQADLQSEKLKQENLQLGQWQPTNWPLNSLSNPLYVSRMLHEHDIKYADPMFQAPAIYSGGTMDEGATLYGSYPMF
jgi:hypothetical protein